MKKKCEHLRQVATGRTKIRRVTTKIKLGKNKGLKITEEQLTCEFKCADCDSEERFFYPFRLNDYKENLL